MALPSRTGSRRPSPTANSLSVSTRSSGPTRLSLRELDPAFRTRTRNPSVRPGPARDLGRVLAVVARVLPAAQAVVDHLLADVGGLRTERRDPVDDVDHEVIAVEVVEHDHVERSRCRALLLVAAHMKVVVIRAPVGKAVDEPRVAV